MSPQGSSRDDPAALERAAEQLRQIAGEARRQAAVMSGQTGRIKPVATGVAEVIGGTASGTDKKMVTTLRRAVHELQSAAQALQEAAQTADRLAYQATARALRAREQSAAQRPRR